MALIHIENQSSKAGNTAQKALVQLLKLSFLIFISSFLLPGFLSAASSKGEQAMVVTQHPLATEAALDILKRGGNAADAAIAAQLVLNVAEPQSSGLGGGGFFLFYDFIKRSVTSLDGRETAPDSTRPDMFIQDGAPIPFSERIMSSSVVGVPGTPALIEKIFQKHASGTFSLEQLAEPAVKLAEEGVPVSKKLAMRLAEHADRLRQFPETKKVFFGENDMPLEAGAVLKQPDLAKALKMLGRDKAAPFYKGEIAKAIVSAVNQSPVLPGNMNPDDLKKYAVIQRDPLYGTYRGVDIFAPGLPTSGGAVLLEALNMLETWDIPELGRDSQALHYLNEVQKLAFEDRRRLGDPGFTEMDTAKMISKENGKTRASIIQNEKALPPMMMKPEDGMQTSHISITDRWGNLVSWTSTIEAPFGSGIMVSGYGFLLNNELTDFDAEPLDRAGKPNPNAPGPGKRPLSSMTPVILFRGGKPYFVLGSPGGTTIPGSLMNVIVNRIDFGMSCEESVDSARMIFRGEKIEMEPELYNHPLIRLQLELWGHDIELDETIGNVQAVCFDSNKQEIVGISDKRGEGSAAGY